ncbi:MAG: KTSC domain-containing protein [Chloroflexi bacterium]|nr:KTSC domain-containing protein [Chloroflexota bacterium]
MERQPVMSSDLASVGYDLRTQTLEIEFVKGGVYQYDGVSVDVYERLVTAPSVGRYFHSTVRNAYPYRRVG